jgi:hypothetical protein
MWREMGTVGREASNIGGNERMKSQSASKGVPQSK